MIEASFILSRHGRAAHTGGKRSFVGGTRSCALPNGVPEPLTILNGVARAGAADNPMEGTVTPQGVLTMRSQRGSLLQGSIGVQGRATGRLTAGCSYQFVWQKQ